MYLFPNAKSGIDFTVRDDGDGRGQFIDIWNLEQKQPSDEQLQNAWEEIQKNNSNIEHELSETEKKLLMLGEQIAIEKIARQKSDQLNIALGQQLAEMKLELLNLKGGMTIES